MTVHFDKARQHWRYDFQRKGVRYQEYCLNEDGSPCTTKGQASRAEERAKTAAQKGKVARPAPGVATLAMVFAAYAPTLPPVGDRFGDDRRSQILELGQQLGIDTPVLEVGAKLTGENGYIAWARQQKVRVYAGGPKGKGKHKPARALLKEIDRLRSDSTINRYLDALRVAIGDFARQRDPATGQPRLPWVPEIPHLKEIQRIPHPVPDADIAAILAVAAPWVVDAATLIRQMGFRKTELVTVPLAQVDLERRGIWLKGEATKGKRDEFVPANAPAMTVLRRRHAQATLLGIDTLFWWVPRSAKNAKRPHPPRPIKDFKKAWKAAKRRAGLQDSGYRIHDLKASFVTAIAPHGPAKTTQKLARHKSFATTERYLAVFDPASRDAVDRMAAAMENPSQKSLTKKRAG